MITDSYGNPHREDRSYRTADNGIISETMEKKDPAINQHQDDSSIRGRYSDTEDNFEAADSNERNEDNDTSDPNFQKNASIAQDLNDEFTDNDRDRRTLDESEADEEEEEEEE